MKGGSQIVREEMSPPPRPDWDGLVKQAARRGITLRVWDSSKPPATVEQVLNSLKNSEAVIVIGHGNGVADQPSGRFQTNQLQFVGGTINTVDAGGVAASPDGETGQPAEVNARVLALITCNSADLMSDAFNMAGPGQQSLILNDGGHLLPGMGTTSTPSLEDSGFKLVQQLIMSDVKDVSGAQSAAQRVISSSRYKGDQDDKLSRKVYRNGKLQ